MPTEINGYSPSEETPLSSLIINEVDSNETFKKMKEKNLLQDNQLYLVTDEQDPTVIDEVPTEGSKNLVYSGGVWTAIQEDSKVLQSHIKNTNNPHGVTAKQVGLGNVGNFKAVSTVASQVLTDTEKSNARANIGAGTSSLTIGTTASTAAAGNHTHTAANVGAVPTSRKVNGKALSADITLSASDVGAYSKSDADTLLQKKANKDTIVNPNLLDNWYFGNPINQRGQTVYTSADNYAPMYGIDRWFTTGNGNKPTVNIKDGYIEFVAAGIYNIFAQKKEAKSYAGKTITLSSIAKSTQNVGLHVVCFDAEGTNLSDSFTLLNPSSDFQLVQRTIDVPESCTIFQYGFLSLVEGETTVAATAYKVELGSQQTLAHQENGVWVLNEIPDYGEQLARCQRYFQTFETESLRHTDALDFRPVMRTNPALSTITVGGKTLYTANADL